ncbi:ethionine resistance protein [Spathaspora passalidarum NRRL Y-27907]|uniref:Ethionine resistance protein n=1 Tax=Spathaspora passalidarum (strain NRRL Y-27907 / 11-Y1) TaxID=619300 RepID=G3AVU2_SPAPN|nr:ethionine resistance protein [Spathaspora passalidarum NRRL Y-27907]EGW29987.1 ethionine resistance protein [Spathaspora passalidarum NRRL Y-27907]
MTQSDRTHQFTHSNTQRRASVVSGSVGKLGLFIPSDFITSPPASPIEEAITGDEIEADETQPLLAVTSNTTLNIRRGSMVARELLEQERDLLKENHITYLGGDEQIMDAFEDAIANKKLDHTTAAIELKSLIKSSVPLVMTFLLQNSLSTVSVFMVGHLGATELAAVSMGAMTANITGYATIQGIATALDTLCPQAFGAKKYTLVGTYLQKCTSLEFVIMLPILFIWVFYGYDLITMILPDKETAKLSAVYLQYVAFGMPAYILFECGKRFLQAQGIYHISTYVLLIAAPSNLIMNYLLVKHIGYLGAPIAVAINYWLMISLLVLFIVFFIKPEDTPSGLHPLKCWGGLDFKESFRGWGRLAQLAIPGLIMLEAEFLAFEIMTLMASYLGTIALAAQSIGTTMACVTYQVPFAVGIASSTRIANYLGAGLGAAARTTTKVSLTFGLLIAFLNFLFLFCFRREIAITFTKDEEVISTISSVMWIIAIMQIADAMNANSAGCLRGQGQTKIGGIVNLFSYYVVGLPLSLYLSFYSPWKGSLHGLWIGSCVALTIIGSVQSYFALAADPEKLCEDARKRTHSEPSGHV